MDLKQIKELMSAMGRTGTKRIRIKQNDYEIELESEDPYGERMVTSLPEPAEFEKLNKGQTQAKKGKPKSHDIPASLHPPLNQHEDDWDDAPGTYVTSPMVGTFYSAPGPDEPPFIKTGDKIEKNTVVGIVEAMKVMNEVKAGVEGVVEELLVESGHPVEFGTKLFRVS